MPSFFNDLPPEIASQYEEIARRKKIQEAMMGQTLQPHKQQFGKSGRYQVAVPYSPLEGATKLIQAAMLNKQAGKGDEAMRQLGRDYQSGGNEVVRNMLAQSRGDVPWREPDPTGAAVTGAGSPYPQGQRASEAMLAQGRSRGQRARPTGSTEGYFVMENGQPKMVTSPETNQPLMPAYADPSMRQQYTGAGQTGKNISDLAYQPLITAANKAAELGVPTPLTPAQKTVDTGFAKDYQEYIASGGYADVQKGIAQLRNTAKQLDEGKENLSGPVMSAQPEWLFKRTFPEAAAARDAVAEVVQRNLRLILGGQFAQKEGEMLLARAYDVALPEKENLKRVNRLIKSIEEAAVAKEASIKYYEENGTLQGFAGKQYTIADFMSAVEDPPEQGFDDADKERRYQEWKASQ